MGRVCTDAIYHLTIREEQLSLDVNVEVARVNELGAELGQDLLRGHVVVQRDREGLEVRRETALVNVISSVKFAGLEKCCRTSSNIQDGS